MTPLRLQNLSKSSNKGSVPRFARLPPRIAKEASFFFVYQAMLRPISRDGHVYALDVVSVYFFYGVPVKVALFSRDTSVFNGFCAKHDKELFAPI